MRHTTDTTLLTLVAWLVPQVDPLELEQHLAATPAAPCSPAVSPVPSCQGLPPDGGADRPCAAAPSAAGHP